MVGQIEQTYESQTQAIARQLMAATQSNRSFFSQIKDQMRWDDKLLGWAMENPGLRVQLFRLIDCLPSLNSKGEIARHLQAYLADPSVELPGALKSILNFTSSDSLPAQAAATTFSKAVETLAHKYIAGETTQQALKTIERLRKQKMAFTMDVLGEAVITETEAQAYLDRYVALIGELTSAAKQWPIIPQIDQAEGEPIPQVQVSVKLTAFYSQFDPLDLEGSRNRVSDRLRILLRKAQDLGAAVHFDMEQYTYKDVTLAILKDLLLEAEFRQRTDVGITLQAYLRDSEQDLQSIIQWAKQRGTPLTVRLVKGAYWDQEIIKASQKGWPLPVYRHKSSTDANFERMTQLLLENHHYLYAAIGSHNVRSQAKAIAIAQELQIPPRAFELQVLYGMADKLAKALVDQGHRVRVYCPYGKLIPGMSYLIRRLLENTANSSFLQQSLELDSAETLLAAPKIENESTEPPVTHNNVPDTDYAIAAEREQAFQALQNIRQQLGQTYWPLINGDWSPTSETTESVNPSNSTEVIGRVGSATIREAKAAVEVAKGAFSLWKHTPAQKRAAILYRAAEVMEQRRDQLAAWMVLETGKVLRECDGEVSEAIDYLRFYADEAVRLEAGYNRDLPGEANHYHYQPRGIALVISPWNFPLAIPTGMTVAALATGNCVILKPAAPSAVIAAKLAEILVEAGIPTGVFQYLPGRGSIMGSYLVKHPDIHLIAFTGSQDVGCQIYADAAVLQPGQHHLKRVIAEMGGKNAVIIDESADLDQAVAGVVQSAFGYSGQKCSACSRVIVLDTVYDAFVRRLVEATKSLNVGPADHPGTTVGPVINAAARDRIREYIAKGQQEAEVALEMSSPEPGYFIGPVIFTNVPSHAVIAQEEIFGPVLSVIRAQDFEEALAIANGTKYALTGGLFSRTPAHIQQARERFEVGNLYINRGITGAIVDRQPFGGFKLSGVGSKAGGRDYLLQFLEPRVITENVQRQGFAPIEGVDS